MEEVITGLIELNKDLNLHWVAAVDGSATYCREVFVLQK